MALRSLMLLAAAASSCVSAYTIANTTYGPVFTNTRVNGPNGEGVTIYRGIPFAEPPLGNLRFHAPVPPTPWTEPRDVSEYGPICAQIKIDGDIFLGSEDCLYLQVYVPDSCVSKAGGCEVFTWIYGGAWILGDNEEFGLYDGTNFAANNNVIVVAMNYRLGPLGFMALSALQAEDPNASTGNAALQDQRAALRWVQDNIGYFYGNPAKVTIGGESAGAFSVCWHLASPASAGLFHQAIMESGTCDAPQFFQPLPDAIDFNSLYATALGCAPGASVDPSAVDIAPASAPALQPASALGFTPSTDPQVQCLRGMSTEHVMLSLLDMLNPNWPFVSSSQAPSPQTGPGSAWNATAYLINDVGFPPRMANTKLPALAPLMPWGAAIDGSSAGLTDLPLNLLQSGKFNKVPLIIGTNKNEGSIFIPALPIVVPGTSFPPKDSDLPLFVEHAYDMFPAALVANLTNNLILPLYPTSAYPSGDNWARGSDLLTHAFFASSTRRAARAVTAAGAPVFLYHFSFALDWPEVTLLGLGDYHSSELSLVFGNEWPPLLHIWSANDREVSRAFQAYWGNFVKYGSPNGPGGANNGTAPFTWPAYSLANGGETNLEIALPLGTTTDLLAPYLDAWDQFYEATKAAGTVPRAAARRLAAPTT